MIRFPPRLYRGDTRGVSWPDTGNSSRNNVDDIFGPRPFAPHIPTVGYDYDFHRGIDVDLLEGDPVYSSIQGAVARLHFTHFGWQATSQLNVWTEEGNTFVATFSVLPEGSPPPAAEGNLAIAINQPGPTIDTGWPNNTVRLEQQREPVFVGDDWVMEIEFAQIPGPPSGNPCGIAIYDPFNDEYVAIEYNGSTLRARGADSGGAMAGDGVTAAVASQTWLRIEQVSGTVNWLYGTDGVNWTTLASDGAPSFTDTTRSVFVPWIYCDTVAFPVIEQFNIEQVNYVDADTIGRFGNWVQIADQNNRRVLNLHMREPTVQLGDVVQAGQQLGTAGRTGFDARSGRIISEHVHIELIEDNDYFYANAAPINPLKPTFYPRVDATNNVTVIVTEENDPDGNASWRFNISVARDDQDFDLNEITVSGNTASDDSGLPVSRTVNFDTRGGLNPDVDVPVFDGVYIVANNFNTSSPAYVLDVYVNKTAVPFNATYEIFDTEGTLLATDAP